MSVGAAAEARWAQARIVPLSELSVEEAVDGYCAIQRDNKNLRACGIDAAVLREYATFLCTDARRYSWNAACVSPDGEVIGVLWLVPLNALPSGDQLPPAAREHWRIFSECSAEIRRHPFARTPEEQAKVLIITFIGFLPEVQGKGIGPVMLKQVYDSALDNGYQRMASWTVNPMLAKALGNNQASMKLMSRAAESLFALPAWVQNNVLMPVVYATGVVPRSHVMLSMSISRFPHMAALGLPNIICVNTPLHGSKAKDRRPAAAGAVAAEGARRAAQRLPNAKL